jgi:class 3 adenylate cyclase
MFRIINWKNSQNTEATVPGYLNEISNLYDDTFSNTDYEDEPTTTRNMSRTSLGTKEHTVIDTAFFMKMKNNSKTSIEIDDDNLKYDLLTNVCICMIDIVGFSSWCSNHLPNVIARAMVEYNDWIGKFVEKYDCVNKIELVGDSCMLVSGTVTKTGESLTDSYLSMIRMAVDLLEDLVSFRNIFKSPKIGIRIGIHVSDVIGIYLNNPYKYQMFGNDINVCSRLENSSIPNTIHISEKTLMCVQNACNTSCGPCSRCVKGCVIYQNYKGVGFKTSYQLFLKKKEICILNTNALFTKYIMNLVPLECFRSQSNLEEAQSDCNSYKYMGVVLNISRERDIWQDSKELMLSLKSNKHFQQSVCLITTDALLESIIKEHEYDFEDILSFQSPDFCRSITTIFERWSRGASIKTERGSLDLTIL